MVYELLKNLKLFGAIALLHLQSTLSACILSLLSDGKKLRFFWSILKCNTRFCGPNLGD